MARPPCESRGPILPAPRRKLHPRPRRRRFLEVEALEARELLAATWTPLVHQPPANIGTMLLLTDGTVMAQGTSVSKEWFQLTPDSTGSYVNGTWSQLASMSLERLYGGTAVLPSGKVLYVGGEFTGPSAMQTETNTGEIYDPVTNKWSPIAPFPERNFGDDPIVVLGNGTVLGGYNGGPQTHVYNPATNTWAAAGGPKLRGDATSEETWIKLPDGSILAADINGSNSTGVPHAQRYVPATNSWVDTGNIPVPLTNSGQEMGPGALLPDGRAVQFGSTGNSALYTPSTNQWAAGPKIPGGMSTDDAPGAILPNGHVIFKADTPPLTSPSKLFDFDPVANTITAMNVPGALSGSLSTSSAYVSRMLVLPSGELLFSDGGNQPWIYNPGTTTTAAWQPTISSVSFDNTTQIYTLTGTQLNGISEGASYGDDAQMASNYPIVRLTNSSGTVFTARTFNWSSQVATGSTPVTTQFKLPAGLPLGLYTLTAIANGIPSAPFSLPVGLTVTNSTPADGTILTAPPSVFNVTFSQAINPGSLQPGALTVNGIASSGATLDATDTVATFTFSSNPVTGQGPQTMAIAAQAVTALNNSTVVNAAFNATFFYDTLPLAIASTSPAAGAIFSPPVGSFTYDVTFNEPIDPGLVGVGNLTLSRGTVTAATLQPGNETVAYTLSGLNAEGPLTVTILAGTFKDQYDNPTSPSFSGTYLLDNGTQPLPTPLASVAPLGSLIYTTSATSVLLFAGDTDQFTLAADPGQTLTVLVAPTAPGLTPMVEISDPSGTSLASVSASGQGQSANLQTIPTTTSGTYTLRVAGLAGTTGNYSIQVSLNAAVGTSNNSLATAQNLDSSFLSLGGGGSRGAAVSRTGSGIDFATDFENGSAGFTINNNTVGTGPNAGLWHLTTRRGTQPGHSPTTSFWYGSETTGTYDTGGRNGGAITSPMIAVSPGDQLSFNYVLQTEGNGFFDLAQVEVSTNGFTSFSTVLFSTSTASLPLTSTWRPVSVSLASFAGQSVQIRWIFDTIDSASNDFEGWYVDDVSVQPPSPPADYYSFSLSAGDRATVALKSQAAGTATLTLEDATGKTLASGTNGGANADQVISGFVASASGTYYLAINRSTVASYSLVVGRDAVLDAKTNSSFGTAQDLSGNSGALGAISATAADWYKVTLAGTQNGVLVQTSTPLSGPAQVVNTLNPSIKLYDASDTLIGSGNLLPDGRNQSLLATGLTPGATYSIRIASANNNPGEYFLAVSSPVEFTTTSLTNWTVNLAGYHQTISAVSKTGAPGSLTFSSTGTLPTGLTLASDGVLSGTPTAVGSYSFTVIATDSLGVSSSANYTVIINPTVAITTATLANGTTGAAYAQTIAVSGGTPPLTFSATGPLPPGLTLSSSGVLSGTPTATGSYPFTVTAADTLGVSDSHTYTVAIFTMNPSTLPNWTVNTSGYNQTFVASGGNGPYTFSTAGTVPPGLTLSGGGVLSGTPTAAGTFNFTAIATDSTFVSAGQDYTVAINPLPSFTTPSLTSWTVNIAGYNQTISATGGTGSLTLGVTGTLPSGLTVSSAGVLGGTPTAAGSYTFIVSATDSLGAMGNQSYTVTINPVVTFTPATLPEGTAGANYNPTITALGGTGDKTLIASNFMNGIPGMFVPNGTNSITIIGSPAAAGTETFTLTATDGVGATSSQVFSFTINPAMNITTNRLSNGTVGAAYSQSIGVTGGTGTKLFGVFAPNLPKGLSLTSDGVLSGTPTTPGSYTFTVAVSDAAGAAASQTYTIVINPVVAITTTTLTGWTVNRPALNQTITATGGTGALTFTEAAGTLPPGRMLTNTGVLVGTPTAVGSFTFTVTAIDTVGSSASKTYTVVINPPVTIATTSLTPWTVNQPGYNQTIITPGGTGSVAFSLSGTLPSGLTLSSAGVLSGTPATSGIFTFMMTATDTTGSSASQNITLTINPTVALSPASLLGDTINVPYNQVIAVTGGTGTATVTVSNLSGAIPGLVVPPSGTGSITLSGTPTATGTETFTVTATDATGAGGSQTYTLVSNPALAIATTSLPAWTAETAYQQTISPMGGTAPVTFAAPAASLPPGLTLSSVGVLSGTPTTAGSFTFTVTATDAVGASAGQSYTVQINPALAIATATLANWTVNLAGYGQTIGTNGGTGSVTFSMTGTLPTGLTLSGGVLSGTPTASGSYMFTVTATDSVGASNSQNYTVTINPALTLSPGILPSGPINFSYIKTITANGGTGTVTLTVGNLTGAIPGLNVPAGGTGNLSITGTPTATGMEKFTLTATDAVGASVAINYSITVVPATVFLSLPTTGFAGSSGGTIASFPISINQLQDQASSNHVGLASATLAVTYPTGVFNFPLGGNLASADVNLGSVPLSDMVAPGGAGDWTVIANAPVDGQLNITLTARPGKNIPTNGPATGGSLVTVNFPVSSSYNPASPTVQTITVVPANGSVHTAIAGNNGAYVLKPTPPYAGSITINPTVQPFSQYEVAVVGSSTVPAGSGFLVTVQAADALGNPITSYSGPASVTASISPTPTSSNFPTTVSIGSNGLGFFLANIRQTGSYTITASSGSFTGSASVTVTPGPAVAVAFGAQPVGKPTGVALPPVTVQVQDLYGNVVTGDNTDAVTIAVANGPGSFTPGSTTTATVHNGVATFDNLTLVVPGSYTLAAQVPFRYTGPKSNPFTVDPLEVAAGSFVGTTSGFSLQFNAPYLVNALTPVLYGQSFGTKAPAPSVILTTDPGNLSDTAAYVEGSLVLDTASNSITFVATNTASKVSNGTPILPDGTYTAVIRGSAGINGFQALNSGGGFVDGLGTGIAGSGDYTATFTVSAAAAHEDVVWVPATADGPGQALSAPGMNQVGGGYPVYLDDSTGLVTNAQVTLNYNPALLTVTGATGAGFTLLGSSTPGQAVLQYSGPALPTGSQMPIGFVAAMVPGGTASNPIPYRAKDLLHLSGVSLNGGAIPVATSDALHLVAYVGDADGNGGYGSNDAVLITRVALQTDAGFAAYPLVDPVIVADTDGAGFIPADAALQANEAGVGFPTANLANPPIPPGVHFQLPISALDHLFAQQAASLWLTSEEVRRISHWL